MALSTPLMGTRWVFPQDRSCRLFREVGPGGICGPSGGEWTALEVSLLVFFFLFNSFFYWRVIALQNFVVFCQTSTWISHRYTYIPSLWGLAPISHHFSLILPTKMFSLRPWESGSQSSGYTAFQVDLWGLGGGVENLCSPQMVKSLPAVQETWVPSLGPEDSPGEGNGNPLQYSCLENPMGRGAGQVTVPGVSKSRTRLCSFHFLQFQNPFQPVLKSAIWPCGFGLNSLCSGVNNSARPSKVSLHFCFLAESLIKLIYLNFRWVSIPSPLYNKGSKSFSKWNLRRGRGWGAESLEMGSHTTTRQHCLLVSDIGTASHARTEPWWPGDGSFGVGLRVYLPTV